MSPPGRPKGRIPECAARRDTSEPAGPPWATKGPLRFRGRIPANAARRYPSDRPGTPRPRAGCRAVKLALAALPALALCACAGLSERGEPAAYAIDPTHTFVSFEVAHFGTSTSRGRFDRTQGTVQLDRAGRAGRVEIGIATASVSTGVPALDGRLRGPDFLDSAAYPDATFVGEDFVFNGNQVSEVAGRLTLLGKTLPLTLKASHFNCYLNPLLLREICGGDFEATLLRSRWGLDYGLNIGIPDAVRLRVQVEAVRQ